MATRVSNVLHCLDYVDQRLLGLVARIERVQVGEASVDVPVQSQVRFFDAARGQNLRVQVRVIDVVDVFKRTFQRLDEVRIPFQKKNAGQRRQIEWRTCGLFSTIIYSASLCSAPIFRNSAPAHR